MKKLLYLIPVILLTLCAIHISLHNDTVNHNPGGDIKSLKPSHWKLREYDLNASFNLSQATPLSSSPSSSQNLPLSDGAAFNGFPFSFYFKNNQTTSAASLQVSAYSWFWILVDGLLIVLTLLIAIFFNRPQRPAEPITTIPTSASPPTYPQPPQPLDPTPQ